MNPGEVAEALPGLPPKDVFDGYLVTGGYPRLVADLVTGAAPAIDLAPFSPQRF